MRYETPAGVEWVHKIVSIDKSEKVVHTFLYYPKAVLDKSHDHWIRFIKISSDGKRYIPGKGYSEVD